MSSQQIANITTLCDLIDHVQCAIITTRGADGDLHSRPITPLETTFDGTAWFIVANDSEIAGDIARDANVSVAYAEPEEETYVAIAGTATVTRDPDRARALWSHGASLFFPRGPGDPRVAVLKVQAHTAEFWAPPEDVLGNFADAARVAMGRIESLGRHGKVDFA